jgi:hypothetical protein
MKLDKFDVFVLKGGSGVKNRWMILLVLFALLVAGLACGSSDGDEDKQVRTLVEPTAEEVVEEGEVEEPEEPTEEPTAVPPTEVPEIEGLLKEGTHLVGTDIESGIYVGLAGDDIFSSCYWARLSNLTGSDDILANDNAVGPYYVEVLEGDKALETGCELLPIDRVPARDDFLTTLMPGTYIVGRDIEAGLYRGQAGDDILESCYWERMSNVSGDDNILANDNATGQYFVEVVATDFALHTGCELEKAD